MTKEDLAKTLLTTIERHGGAVTWYDLAIGVDRAMERKLQELTISMFSGMSLQDLASAKEVVHGFAFPKPASTVSTTAAVATVEPAPSGKNKRNKK